MFNKLLGVIKMNLSSKKVIVIAGTTGVGKSQLSIQLAKKFNGEVINSDSMQMYKHLPVITNKHPIEEREGIPHHVMNHVNWDEEYYIHRFEKECLDVIDDIHSRGKVAIVVGGTHYYLQTLFNKSISISEETRDISEEEKSILYSNDPDLVFRTLLKHDPTIAGKFHPNDTRRVQRLLEIYYKTGQKPSEAYDQQEMKLRYPTLFLWLYSQSEELNERLDNRVDKMLETLLKHDPTIAGKFHPNDTRRVQRLLEIYYKTGQKPSEAYDQQEMKLRYPTLFLWLYSQSEELNERLDNRVDKMLETRGMEEVTELFQYYTDNNFTPEQCENGVWQVIGFKEFLPWLLKDPKVKLEDCVDMMKIRTRQYAKKQVKWIKKQLLMDIKGDIYVLNATDLSKWSELVADRSDAITQEFIEDKKITQSHAPTELQSLLDDAEDIENNKNTDFKHYACSICRDQNDNKLIAIGEKNWKIHLKGKRHKSNMNRGKKKAEYEKYKLRKTESAAIETQPSIDN